MKKRNLLQILFGRTSAILILLIIQIVILFDLFTYLGEYINYIYGGITLLSIFTAIYIINSKSNPNFKLSWLVPVLLVPILGTLFYIFVQMEFGTRKMKKTLKKIHNDTQYLLKQNKDTISEIKEIDTNILRISNYMNTTSGYPIYKNSNSKYYEIGEKAFESMLEELEKAENFIFMEYFIIDKGEMLDKIQSILEKKAAEGVEVRFMYDGMVSIAQIPNSYMYDLISKNIKTKQFLPIKPVLSTVYNNRDHRKIMVIDGRVAFTGGINIADEYINKIVRFGHWKDNAIKITGEAVKTFTLMFLQMWNVDEPNQEDYNKYINFSKPLDSSEGYILPYADSPLDDERVGENIYLNIINSSKKYVHIMTPYLVIDDIMITMLTMAAKSGVDIKIIMPHIPDKKYAFLLARTYYRDLMESGIKIYEYLPGFIHSKIFVSDDLKATVGTVNLDYRSMYLNFECGVYLYKNNSVLDIERDFQETLALSKEVTLEDLDNESILYKGFARIILRLFAPLL